MAGSRIGTQEDWAAAREELLAREKEYTRLGDDLARQRRELPWVAVEKEYRFDTDDGTQTLAELFNGRSQLAVYHFMFGPDYEAGCPTCASIADAVNGVLPHLNARDVTTLFVSQGPLAKLQAYKRRMGWSFPWVSSADTEFNVDLGFSNTEESTRDWVTPIPEALPPIAARNASETGTGVVRYLTQGQGFSVFVRDGATIYHTYSTGGRGVEFLMGYYPILDHTPKGRDEGEGFQLWIRPHDEYAAAWWSSTAGRREQTTVMDASSSKAMAGKLLRRRAAPAGAAGRSSRGRTAARCVVRHSTSRRAKCPKERWPADGARSACFDTRRFSYRR